MNSSAGERRGLLPLVVVALPTLAAIRGLVPTFFLLVVAGMFVTALAVGFENVTSTPVSRSYLILVASWGILSLALLLVIPPIAAGTGPEQFAAGVTWLLAISASLLLGLILLLSRAAEWGLEQLRRGWVIAFLGTGCVAIWEVRTGHHLSTGFIQDHGLASSSQATAVSTFFNPNDYASFIAMAFPFLVWSAWRARRLSRLTYVALCLSAVIAVVFQGSTLVLLALGAELCVLVLTLLRHRFPRRTLPVWAAAAVLVALAIGGNLVTSAASFDRRVRSLSTQQFGSSSSGNVRINLLLNGLAFTERDSGIGYGPGQFEALMQWGDPAYPTTDDGIHIINAHDVFAEVLVNLGIAGLATFLFFLWRVWRACRIHTLPALAARMSLVGFLFSQAASSSLVKTAVFGIFVGSMLVLGIASESYQTLSQSTTSLNGIGHFRSARSEMLRINTS